MLNKLKENTNKITAVIVPSAVAILTTWLTSTGGVIEFEAADKDAIGEWFTNALSNIWAWFTVILPYIGMAVWVMLVIWTVYKLIFKRG